MRIYGPVPSRRFGLSLGVDVVPHKTCTFDCVYCQLGATNRLVGSPEEFYPLDEIFADVEEALADGPKPDVVTLAGSGEPTLFHPLAELIDGLKELADCPVLLITNSSLLYRDDVAEAVLRADILAPSLDAGDRETFERINRPHPDLDFERMLDGLARVTHRHPGEIRLEVMLIRGMNDDPQSIGAIAARLDALHFDQIDVNTPVRPPVPERGALPCDEDVLERALAIFGPSARAIGKFESRGGNQRGAKPLFSDLDKDIREMLLRRPCTLADIISATGRIRNEVVEALERLTRAGLIDTTPGHEAAYFTTRVISPKPEGRRRT